MKALVLFPLAAAFLVPVSFAQAATASDAQSTETARMMSAVDDTLKALEKMVVTLESIKDTASADAAAQQLPEIVSTLKMMEEKLDTEHAVSQQMQRQLSTKAMPVLMELMPRLEKTLQNLESNKCYGSQKLIDVLMNL